MDKKTKKTLTFARNTWFGMICLIMLYQILIFVSAGSFNELRQNQGLAFALLFVVSTFIVVFVLLQIPAIIIHSIMVYEERKNEYKKAERK